MRYEAELKHLGQILQDADKELASLAISESVREQLRLALEEAVVNIMHYAYPNKTEKPLEFVFKKEGALLTIQLKDWGVPFDPTAVSKKIDPNLPLEEIPIGGLGILVVKKMVDEMRYRRDKDCNELTLLKKI